MSFTPQFLDEIRARLRVSDVVGRRVKLTKKGREYSGLCPFHNEKTPSFTVNDDKAFFHCFGCGEHGDVIGFVMKTEGASFPEAVEKLAGEAGLEVPRQSPQERERFERQKTLADVCEAAANWFAGRLKHASGREALAYLKDRGLTDKTIAGFRLGHAPDERDALKKALMADGIDEAQLIEAGLIIKPDDGRPTYDRFRGRIMFPITDRRGRVIAFGGRILGDGQPKYLNSPETPLFNKSRVLYGLAPAREAVRRDATVIVTEGYMDVIALHQAGFDGAVAPLGTALTEGHIEELWRLVPEPVLCFDGDEAGRRAAARAADRVMPLLKPGFSLRFALLPPGEDPDSLVKDQGPDAFASVLDAARPLVDMVWEIEASRHRADTPERKAALRKALMDQAREIAERSVQDLYVAEFDRRFRAAVSDAGGRRAPARNPRYQQGRGGANTTRNRPGYGAGGGLDWEDSGLRSDGNVDVLALRQQQAMLAVLIAHPGLINDVSEQLVELELPAGELDKIRHEVIKTADQGLDSQAMQNHLVSLGFSGALSRVLSREVFVLAPFARPEADLAAAETGWRHLFAASQRRQQLLRERARAEAALADDVSERNWAYLNAVTHQAWSADDEGEDGVRREGPAGSAGPHKVRG